jgi:hypothetical protein
VVGPPRERPRSAAASRTARRHQHPTRLGHHRAHDQAVRTAAARTRVHHAGTPQDEGRSGWLVFRFGRQIDVRPIRSTDFTGNGPVTDRHVAAYIAKYATKGAETTTGILDRRLRFLVELAQHNLTDHARRMIHTAWHLGTQLQHAHLRLRQWAHMLGFRGHFSTRTRYYTATLAHLRAERTAWRTSRSDAPEAASAPAEPQSGQVTDGRPVGDRPGSVGGSSSGGSAGCHR